MKSYVCVSFGKTTLKLVCTALVISAVALAGCGSNEKVAKVTGKVTAESKLVTGGTLIFSPVSERKNPGAPAVVHLKDDGSFESPFVVIGKNTIVYNPPPAAFPEGYDQKPSEAPPLSPFYGLVPESKEVEVKGDTAVEIKLVRKN